MAKIAGSPGSQSISQGHGSADPDPHQNVMDSQHCKTGRWVAKLVVAHLLATAALWVQIQTSLKNTKLGRHKQRSDQNTLYRHKKYFFFEI